MTPSCGQPARFAAFRRRRVYTDQVIWCVWDNKRDTIAWPFHDHSALTEASARAKALALNTAEQAA